MDRVLFLMRGTISALGWTCGLLAVATPGLFLVAALGTRWEFWDWSFGLETLTHGWGAPLIWVTLTVGGLMMVLCLIYRVLSEEFHGVFSASILAILVGLAGVAWTYVIDQRRESSLSILDVTTDFEDPPQFSANFRARYGANVGALTYAGKTDASGRLLSEVQAEAFPGLISRHVDAEPRIVFRRALLLARETGWSIGAASETAGMFEAGAESFWFGFRDDIVVRVRAVEEGGAIVDMRSVARQPVHDLGRNPRRVVEFLDALAGGDAGP